MNYKVILSHHYYINNEMYECLQWVITDVSSDSIFGALGKVVSLDQEKIKYPNGCITSLYVRNTAKDLYDYPWRPRKKIKYTDEPRRMFIVNYIDKNNTPDGYKVYARNIQEGIQLVLHKLGITQIKSDEPDYFRMFQIWEDNWHIR